MRGLWRAGWGPSLDDHVDALADHLPICNSLLKVSSPWPFVCSQRRAQHTDMDLFWAHANSRKTSHPTNEWSRLMEEFSEHKSSEQREPTMELPSHAKHLLGQLNKQRSKGFLCDVVIVVENALFRAHKAVLAASSLYFKSLVVHDNLINLDSDVITPPVFRAILEYIYTGRLAAVYGAVAASGGSTCGGGVTTPVASEPGLAALLTAASYLQLPNLVALCRKRLKRNGRLGPPRQNSGGAGGGVAAVVTPGHGLSGLTSSPPPARGPQDLLASGCGPEDDEDDEDDDEDEDDEEEMEEDEGIEAKEEPRTPTKTAVIQNYFSTSSCRMGDVSRAGEIQRVGELLTMSPGVGDFYLGRSAGSTGGTTTEEVGLDLRGGRGSSAERERPQLVGLDLTKKSPVRAGQATADDCTVPRPPSTPLAGERAGTIEDRSGNAQISQQQPLLQGDCSDSFSLLRRPEGSSPVLRCSQGIGTDGLGLKTARVKQEPGAEQSCERKDQKPLLRHPWASDDEEGSMPVSNGVVVYSGNTKTEDGGGGGAACVGRGSSRFLMASHPLVDDDDETKSLNDDSGQSDGSSDVTLDSRFAPCNHRHHSHRHHHHHHSLQSHQSGRGRHPALAAAAAAVGYGEPETFGDNLYVCIPCGKGFPSSEQLNAHVDTHTEEELYPRDDAAPPVSMASGGCTEGVGSTGGGSAGPSVPMSVAGGAEDGIDLRPYRCTACDRAYKDAATLRQHEKTHWLTRPYPCAICGKKFTQRGTMTRHMRSHLGLKPFACDECGMRFTRQYRLTEHMRIHSGEKPYECQLCGGKFAQQRNLISHMKMHSAVQAL
uniref:hypermethylated in cancer 2 protein-like isoform X1 n=3 Tax=Myxine glutinosa TaxID=7769 RepID=UPI00358F3A6C